MAGWKEREKKVTSESGDGRIDVPSIRRTGQNYASMAIVFVDETNYHHRRRDLLVFCDNAEASEKECRGCLDNDV